MSVTAVVLLLACAPSSSWTVDVDAQIVGKQNIVPSQIEPHMLLGLRGGLLSELPYGVHAGFDLGLHIEPLPRTRGNTSASSLALEASVAPRGVLGWRAAWGPLAVLPYLYAGPFGGFRLALLTVLDEGRNGSHLTGGARGGAGVRFFVGRAVLSLELGAGLREDGPETSGVFSAGFWL